jgi:hypothetical protein
MFVSLVGRLTPGAPFRVLVGDPRMAADATGRELPEHGLAREFDDVAAQLASLGMEVIRNPLPYVSWQTRSTVRVTGPDGVERTETFDVTAWYYATSNNSLVWTEGERREVWLPTYGHPPLYQDLAATDDANRDIWEGLGFAVHQMPDFHPFARNHGALHCIKKYLRR